MTKLAIIGTGICSVCLIAFLLIAGCTQAGGDNSAQTPIPTATPQITATPASADQGSASADSGALIDDSQDVPTPSDQSQVTLAPDETVVAGSGAAGTNLTTDSADLGDIMP